VSAREPDPQRPFAAPPGATELVLVRHGASAPLVPGEPLDLIDGQSDPPLAPEGRRQAEAVCARLSMPWPAALFVTPLRRTSQTAQPLAARTGLEPVVVPELREVHMGDWEAGEYRARAARRDPLVRRAFSEERWDVIPGAEPMDELARRVRAGAEAVLEAVGPDATAVAFVHGGVIAELCRQATASRPFAFINTDNASITRLVVLAGGRWLLRGFNDTAHLTEGAPRE
jgi:probable phosphoglycerate mutase